MDLQKLNELLDSLEAFVQSATEESVKEENKQYIYAEISNLRVNPTPEHYKTFFETIGDYLYIPKTEGSAVQTTQDVAVEPNSEVDLDETKRQSEESDKSKLEELLAKLKAMSSANMQEEGQQEESALASE